jgi:hypothetical protein
MRNGWATYGIDIWQVKKKGPARARIVVIVMKTKVRVFITDEKPTGNCYHSREILSMKYIKKNTLENFSETLLADSEYRQLRGLHTVAA